MIKKGIFISLIALGSISALAQPIEYRVRTFAGTGTQGAITDGAPATSSDIGGGWALTFDPNSSRLYYSSSTPLGSEGVNRIQYIDVVAETIHNVIGDGYQGTWQDSIPVADKQVSIVGESVILGSNMYFCESLQSTVWRYDMVKDSVYAVAGTGGYDYDLVDSTMHYFEGGDTTKLWGPIAIAHNPVDGKLYFTDIYTIRRYDPATGVIDIVAGIPGALGYSANGTVVDYGNTINPRGGICVDSNGHIYYSTKDHTIRKIEFGTWKISTVAGTHMSGGYNGDGPALSTKLDNPYGLQVGPEGHVWFADRDNGMIRVIKNDSVITAFGANGLGIGGWISGNQEYEGSENGSADDVKMNPYDLAFGWDGSIYVSDLNNYRIREFYPCTPPELVAFSNYDENACPDDSILVYLDGDLKGNENWEWRFDSCDGELISESDTAIFFKPDNRPVYLTVKPAAGCTASLCEELMFTDPDCSAIKNNAFSPNGDGINDYFHIDVATSADNVFFVYNRYGDEIWAVDGYDNDNPDARWSGQTYLLLDAKPGTYYFMFGYTDETGVWVEESGYVQLVK